MSSMVMRVLDLGCGSGQDLASWGITKADQVMGLDIDGSALLIAKTRFPNRLYTQGVGEHLPFKDGSFDRIVSAVALPYMKIPQTLAEIYRVLVPGGHLSLSLHLPSFTISELIHNAIPKPVPTVFRLYVLANGLFFHITGRTLGFLNGRTESFQTERGMRIALKGFANFSFHRGLGRCGETFVVEAEKMGEGEIMKCVIRKGIFDRWFIFHPDNIVKAWSGSRWVTCSYDGNPRGVQVCNFESEQEARNYCQENGLEPL